MPCTALKMHSTANDLAPKQESNPANDSNCQMSRVGQNRIYNGTYTEFLAGKLRNVRSYTVYIYGSAQSHK